ncbi:MAG TPA: M24 family metallopeptidase [Candidatus Limnocylindria bacterium]|nr:M24 family metallopeptidase [Candidatus Limnocylindria bacterium]
MAFEKPIIPTFSMKERDRRWSLLRAAMKQADFDALIALPHEGHWDQFGCDTRYVTQIGGTQTEVGCVVPLEADVTAVVRGENEIEWWGLAQDWVTDIRPSRRSYGEPVIDRLKEVRAVRVGVVALSGMVRAPEGVVPWGTFEKIRTALPNVKFANATDVMQEVRSVKSAEEVSFIEKAAEIIGHANEVLIQHAKVGVGEHELIAEMLREIVRRGGEPITMMLFGTGGPEVPWAQRVFTTRKLKAGDLINTEVEGKYAGYIAQALQPISLGPKPKELEKIFDATKVIFDRMVKFLKPGISFGAVAKFYQDEVAGAGYEPDGALMHGRGLGEDAPMLWGARKDFPEKDQLLKEGHVFILKPACKRGFMRDSIRAGDTVAIEANGARRLGKRDLTFVTV